MSIASRFNSALALASGLAAAAYAASEGSFWLFALSTTAVFIAWRLGRNGVPVTLPRPAVAGLVMLAILDAILGMLDRTAPPVSDLSEFLLYIQLIKLFDRQTPRDSSQALSLSLFIAIGAVLTSNTLPVGVLLLLYMPAAIVAAMLWHLHEGDDQLRRLNIETTPPTRASNRQFRMLSTGAIVGTLLLSVFAFLVTPRGLGEGVLGGFGQLQGATTGFTDRVRLGRSGFISESPTPVLELTVSDTNGVNLGNRSQTWYLRGGVNDIYRVDGTWEHSLESISFTVRTNAIHALSGERIDLISGGQHRVTLDARIDLRPGVAAGAPFFSIWHPLSMTPHDDMRLGKYGRDMVLQPDRGASADSYTIRSSIDYIPDAELYRQPELNGYTRRLGFRAGPIRNLSRAIIEAEGIDPDPTGRDPIVNRTILRLYRNWLENQCTYTLDMIAPAPGEDPIEMFMFRTKRGHCEYFASALAAMCQSVGLDARLVTGYVATEFNPSSGRYTIRQSHAHAWTEVEIAPTRWTTVDPTPAADFESIHRPTVGLIARARRWYESLEFRWARSIVSFDEYSRSRMLGITPGASDLDLPDGESMMNRIRKSAILQWIERVLPFGILTPVVLLGAIVAFTLIVRRILLLAFAHRSKNDLNDPELEALLGHSRFYQDAVELLASIQSAPPPWQPPLAFAQTLTNQQVASPFTSLANLYYRARFGRTRLSTDDLQSAEQTLDQLRLAVETVRADRTRAVR